MQLSAEGLLAQREVLREPGFFGFRRNVLLNAFYYFSFIFFVFAFFFF
jgi:hypothetical protein